MKLPRAYFERDGITLYHGNAMLLLPLLLKKWKRFDATITDPPYGETSLRWDVWPAGWPHLVHPLCNSLWCFGSLKMFLAQRDEFKGWWQHAQEIVWEKHNGSGAAADRFRRVHELAVQFYHGTWGEVFKQPPVVAFDGEEQKNGHTRRRGKPTHFGEMSGKSYFYGGTRFERSVMHVRSCHGHAENETQKPEGIVAPLMSYSVPPGGVVLDCFAGSGTTLAVARTQGKRAVGIELREEQCEAIARRLSQAVFQFEQPKNPQL